MSVYAQVPDRRPVDPGPGEHLWIATVAYKIPDDVARAMAEGREPDGVFLDHENVLTTPGIGCYKCEKEFSRRLFFRKCVGSMEPL